MTAESRFWDRTAQTYAQQPIADEAAYETKLRVTRTYLTPQSEVLELGCGTGSTALLHAPFVRHIRAIDFSARMIGIAREKAEREGVVNVDFEQADITTLVFPADGHDAVLALSILHLLKDPDALIRKAFDTLKPGGVLVTSTTCAADTIPFLRPIAPIGHALGLLPQLNFLTADGVAAKISGAGFEIVHRWLPGKGKAVFIIGKKPG